MWVYMLDHWSGWVIKGNIFIGGAPRPDGTSSSTPRQHLHNSLTHQQGQSDEMLPWQHEALTIPICLVRVKQKQAVCNICESLVDWTSSKWAVESASHQDRDADGGRFFQRRWIFSRIFLWREIFSTIFDGGNVQIFSALFFNHVFFKISQLRKIIGPSILSRNNQKKFLNYLNWSIYRIAPHRKSRKCVFFLYFMILCICVSVSVYLCICVSGRQGFFRQNAAINCSYPK